MNDKHAKHAPRLAALYLNIWRSCSVSTFYTQKKLRKSERDKLSRYMEIRVSVDRLLWVALCHGDLFVMRRRRRRARHLVRIHACSISSQLGSIITHVSSNAISRFIAETFKARSVEGIKHLRGMHGPSRGPRRIVLARCQKKRKISSCHRV